MGNWFYDSMNRCNTGNSRNISREFRTSSKSRGGARIFSSRGLGNFCLGCREVSSITVRNSRLYSEWGWVFHSFADRLWNNRLTDGLMGICLDPSDCNQGISELSVGPFRGYPLIQILTKAMWTIDHHRGHSSIQFSLLHQSTHGRNWLLQML